MTSSNTLNLKEIIRDIPDFPKKGIIFKDITPILKDPEAFRQTAEQIEKALGDKQIDYVVGIESRGFIFSPILAQNLKAGFIPVRKKGKLPYDCEEVSYSLEYGEAILEIHKDAIEPGSRVVIIDDLLATGGTALAAAELIEKLGGKVEQLSFVIELSFLKGREKLSAYDVSSLITY